MRAAKLANIGMSLVGAGMMALGAATAAGAVEVKQEVTVPAGQLATWRKIGAFCGIKEWHPAIANCERSRVGTSIFRTLTLKDGGKIKEKLSGIGKVNYSYTIEESPLPVKNYTATIGVAPSAADKSQSTITWTAKFDAKDKPEADAKATIEGIFKAGLDSLKTQITADAEKSKKAADERRAKIEAAKLTVLEKTAAAKAAVAEKAKQAADAAKAAYEKAKAAVQGAMAPAKPADAKK